MVATAAKENEIIPERGSHSTSVKPEQTTALCLFEPKVAAQQAWCRLFLHGS